jgi:multidrug resistance efflux pump
VAAVGLVEPSSENIAVSTPVSGLVVVVHVKAGDRVPRGAPLFSLDDRDLKAELALRMTNLEVARSRLARLEHAPRPEEIPQAEAKVREAEADLADAQNQQRLIESVVDKRAIREEDVLRRREATRGALARLDEARAALALLQAGTWVDDLAVARAEVANAEAQVRRVEADLERLTMRAPITGEVLQLNVRVGEYAQAGQLPRPLLVMGEVGRLHVRADIDENDVWRLQPGSPAQAAERGNSSRRAALEFVRFEPMVVPKKSLTGDSTERVDTRVLQAIFRFTDRNVPFFVGQQMDVFVEASGDGVAR